ncbi:MAG: AEC family transporter [Phycisphaerae bacterium]
MTATILANPAVSELLSQLGHLFYYIVLPVLLLAAVGFVLQRRLTLDMATLRVLNFYFVIPCIIYVSVVTSRVTPGDVGTVVLFTLAMMAVSSVLVYLAAVVRGVPADLRSALLMTVIFHNTGNFGLPLQALAFRPAGLSAEARSLQSFAMITQNFTTFTFGILLAAGGGAGKDRHWKQNLMHIVKFPPLYALAAGILTVQVRTWLGPETSAEVLRALWPFWDVVVRIQNAFIAVALCTLGAQLALVRAGGKQYPITLSVILRLLMAPAIGIGMVYLFGVRGFLAQMLLISTCNPTAVNCMMLCLEFDNHPDFAAKAVFYSTLLSPITVTGVIFLAQSGILPGFAIQ